MSENTNETTNTVKFGDWFITDAPRTLDDIYGQPTIVKALKAMQKSGTYSKSTFFQGQFGSGKTAMAKILAKSIACKHKNANGEPCNECETCKAIDTEKYGRDVVYLNAEEMSADDVRDALDKGLKFPPVRDAAKVFIVDETQALSKEAVEAFLTATQSPRQGYFFIFTAMDKLKGGKAGALQSRCKVWKMKTPTVQDVYMYLAKVCQKREMTKDASIPKDFFGEGLQFIAQNCEYSFRKAIQMLEQCYTSQIFTKDEMKETFDIVSYEDACAALVDIANGNDSQLAWNAIDGSDYQDKFPLMLKIIGDAQSIKAFGIQYIESEERWKWDQAIRLSTAKYFDDLRDGFMELAGKAYISRGEWKIVCSKIMAKARNIDAVPVARAGRSRPQA